MTDIVYGVSLGDYAAGLLLRAYRNGFQAAIYEDQLTDTVFVSYMLQESDDRQYDATTEQWQAARTAFDRGWETCKAVEDDLPG